MKEFIKSKREVISLVIYAALIGVLIYFLIMPLLAKINTVRDQIQEDAIKQEIKSQNIKELPKIEQQFKMLEENKQYLNVLIDKNNAVPLIEKLENLAEISGNKILIEVQEVAQLQKATAAKNKNNQAQENALINSLPSTNYLQLKITLNGNLESIGKYVYMVEKFDYFSDITSVQLSNRVNKKTDFSENMFTEKNDQDVKQTEPESEMEAVLDLVFYAK